LPPAGGGSAGGGPDSLAVNARNADALLRRSAPAGTLRQIRRSNGISRQYLCIRQLQSISDFALGFRMLRGPMPTRVGILSAWIGTVAGAVPGSDSATLPRRCRRGIPVLSSGGLGDGNALMPLHAC
jgi:hypothetical protein